MKVRALSVNHLDPNDVTLPKTRAAPEQFALKYIFFKDVVLKLYMCTAQKHK